MPNLVSPDVSQVAEAQAITPENTAGSPPIEKTVKNPTLKELLDLPEHQIEEKTYEEKFARVMDYAKEKAEKQDSHFFQKDYSAQAEEDRLGSMTRKELSLMEKAQRKWANFTMKQAGIKDANAMIQFLEKHTTSVAYDQIPTDNIARLLKHLDVANEEHAMEKLQVAFERFRKMALYPSQDNFTSEDFVDWVQISAEAPEDVFEKVITDLDPYGFIYRDSWLTQGEDTDMLFDIIEAGGLTQEQKEVLDKEQLWVQTAGGYSLQKGLVYLHTALSPQISSRIDSHMPYIVDFADHQLTIASTSEDPIVKENPVEISARFVGSLDFLKENGALPVMDELKKRGWSLKTTYYEMDSYQTQSEKIFENIQKASQLAGNEDDIAFVGACEQVFFDMPVIDPSRVDLYEQMIARQEELTNLALVMDMLPNKGKRKDYYPTIVSVNNNGELMVSYGNLTQEVQEARGNANNVQYKTTNRIIDVIGNAEGRARSYGTPLVLQSSDLPLMGYMTKYYKQFSVQDVLAVSDADLITGAVEARVPIEQNVLKSLLYSCSDPEKLPPDLIWQHLDAFAEWRRSNLLSVIPPEFITTLSIVDQQFLHFLQSHDKITQRFLLENRDKFGEFFVNGLPTVACVAFCDKEGDFHRTNAFISDDVLATFSVDDRNFWQAFRSLPLIGERVLLDNRENFAELFVNGKPTNAFLNVLTDPSVAYQRNMEDILSIVTSADLTTFPEPERKFWEFCIKIDHISTIQFLITQRDHFEDFVVDGKPTEKFLEKVGSDGDYEVLRIGLRDIDFALLPDTSRMFWQHIKEQNVNMQQFLLTQRADFDQLVVDGKPTEKFLERAGSEGNYSVLEAAMRDMDFASLPDNSRMFWQYVKEQNVDMQRFVLSKPREMYVRDGVVDTLAISTDFLHEIRLRPEECSTYESLDRLFGQLARDHLDPIALGDTYLRIAAAHRVRTIDRRTEVEAIPSLRRQYAALWYRDMEPFERMSWKVLQRQLPFTSNETMRETMREQALVVEALDNIRLSWVHQSVHNYASVHEVPYLKALRTFLEIGDRTALDTFAAIHVGDSKAPAYTAEDRLELLGLPDLMPQLDTMISDASQFYEIHPETLAAAAFDFSQRLRGVPESNEIYRACTVAEVMLKNLQGKQSLETEEDKNTAVRFVQNANKAREKLHTILGNTDWKEQGLVLDTVLDDLTQKILTQYKDYLEARKDTLSTTTDILEAASMLGETIVASYYNGEVSPEALKTAEKLQAFNEAIHPTSAEIHAIQLLLPVLKQKYIDAYWQKFSEAASPEMVAMLIRTGMSEEEAERRVVFTDLVEFRKSTTAYLLDPLLDRMESLWEQIDPVVLESTPSPEEIYKELLGETMVKVDTDEASVADFIKDLQAKGSIPEDLQGAKQFLSEIGRSSAADAERLVCRYVSGYEQKTDLERYPVGMKLQGKQIEFFPLSYYGVDMVVIKVDGKRVEDPKEFMIKNFKPSKVAIDLLREGD